MASLDVIQTIKQNCRRCYTCVRECPAKAIRIVGGQASVVTEFCVACGNCTTVCSQGAKTYVSGLGQTLQLLSDGGPVAALVAPSFPAEFSDVAAGRVVGALKAVGFRLVIEVAYGADLVSAAYRDFFASQPAKSGPWIATTCPSFVDYVRKYHPQLVSRLVPIVSPMIATAQAVRARYGEEVRCVFIGPCTAKKREARDPLLPPIVDEVLTFQEMRRLLHDQGIALEEAPELPFDPPAAGVGRVFPFTGGLLRSAGLASGPYDTRLMVVSGHQEAAEVLDDIERGHVQPLLLEALMCRGCHAGPGMSVRGRRLYRKNLLMEYLRRCGTPAAARAQKEREPAAQAAPEHGGTAQAAPEHGGTAQARPLPDRLPVLALHRFFQAADVRQSEPTEQEVRVVLARTNKFSPEDELNCGACGYATCRAKAVAVLRGLAEEAMCLPFMVEQAERMCHELKVPWRELREIHRHIINTEKLASMGQLAAGIAHELNNPLGTLLLYTGLLERKLKERTDLQHDLGLLSEEAKRCKKIVAGLLDFARQNRVSFERVEVGALVGHVAASSFSASDLAQRGIELYVEPPASPVYADLDRDQMTQVLVNLIQNAVEAMDGREGAVRLSVQELPEPAERVHIAVIDQGSGIPPEDRDRVFQPFFTTKRIGKGTGLGLPISYGIVKMHRGSIWFDTAVGSGTTFHIELPRTQARAAGSILQ